MNSDTARRLYDREYYLGDCEGYREFARSDGRKLSRRLRKCLYLLELRPDEVFLDLGCGRGEIALHTAERGVRTVAVDPSPDALNLMREAAASGGWGESNLLAVLGRGQEIPVAERSVDALLLSDVVEHLTPAALALLLREARRVLRPRGRLLVHTQPNRLLVDTAVPLLSRVSRLWGVRLPRDLREEMSTGARPPYHVNELSLDELVSALTDAGFSIDEAWLEGSYPVYRIFGNGRLGRVMAARFRRSPFLKRYLASQIFVRAKRRSGARR